MVTHTLTTETRWISSRTNKPFGLQMYHIRLMSYAKLSLPTRTYTNCKSKSTIGSMLCVGYGLCPQNVATLDARIEAWIWVPSKVLL